MHVYVQATTRMLVSERGKDAKEKWIKIDDDWFFFFYPYCYIMTVWIMFFFLSLRASLGCHCKHEAAKMISHEPFPIRPLACPGRGDQVLEAQHGRNQFLFFIQPLSS